eukprot:6399648-Ditylum_brightwellii.AAC.1
MIPLPDDSIHHRHMLGPGKQGQGPGPVRRQILQTMKKSRRKTQAKTAGASNHHYQLGFSGCCIMIVCMLGILFAWVQYFQWRNTLSSTTMPIPVATVTTKPNSLPAKDKDAFA